jgi:single-strand DNA-binding protein
MEVNKMMNHISLMGRFVRDPELRHTKNGTPVASFTLAVERDYKSPSGEKDVDFIDIVAWRHTADFVSKYFSKGRMATVEGRLQLRDWVDRENNKRRSAEIVANNVYFADSAKAKNNTANVKAPYGAAPVAEGMENEASEELPF